MRVIGIILVVLGALGLGWEGFTFVTTERVNDGRGETVQEKRQTIWVPPVVSGIAVVSGLIVLASNGRRDDL